MLTEAVLDIEKYIFHLKVIELGRDLQSFHQLLSSILSQPKLRYIFDGLGHLCAAIFIHSR